MCFGTPHSHSKNIHSAILLSLEEWACFVVCVGTMGERISVWWPGYTYSSSRHKAARVLHARESHMVCQYSVLVTEFSVLVFVTLDRVKKKKIGIFLKRRNYTITFNFMVSSQYAWEARRKFALSNKAKFSARTRAEFWNVPGIKDFKRVCYLLCTKNNSAFCELYSIFLVLIWALVDYSVWFDL